MARSKVNKNIIEKLKPFTIKHFKFFPCVFAESLKAGYKYVLYIKDRKNLLPINELLSPRFYSKEEANNFVNSNPVLPYIV